MSVTVSLSDTLGNIQKAWLSREYLNLSINKENGIA